MKRFTCDECKVDTVIYETKEEELTFVDDNREENAIFTSLAVPKRFCTKSENCDFFKSLCEQYCLKE